MSQRQKTSRSSQSTQTDLSNSSSSWSLLDAAALNGLTADLPPSSYGNCELPLSPAHVPRGSTSSSLLPSTTAASAATAAASQQVNGEFYEDAAAMFDKLVKAEEVGRRIPNTAFLSQYSCENKTGNRCGDCGPIISWAMKNSKNCTSTTSGKVILVYYSCSRSATYNYKYNQ